MSPANLLIILLLLCDAGHTLGKNRSFAVTKSSGGPKVLHSRPVYYGSLTALWCAIPALIIFCVWLTGESGVIADMELLLFLVTMNAVAVILRKK
ncbi:MAG: phosphate ABC transporter permease family protein [Pseudomonadota bacterium]